MKASTAFVEQITVGSLRRKPESFANPMRNLCHILKIARRVMSGVRMCPRAEAPDLDFLAVLASPTYLRNRSKPGPRSDPG